MVSGSAPRAACTAAALSLLGALLSVSNVASACPSCAGNPEGKVARFILIGLMIATPYVATTFVVRFIRKGEAAMASEQPDTARTQSAKPA